LESIPEKIIIYIFKIPNKQRRRRMKKTCPREISTRLTIEERNPRHYLYNSSKEMKWLRKEIAKGTKVIDVEIHRTTRVLGTSHKKNATVKRIRRRGTII